MNEILKGPIGIWAFTTAWLLPSLTAVGMYAYLVITPLQRRGLLVDLPSTSTDATTAIVLIACSTLVVATLLALQGPLLWAVTTGRALPSPLKARMVQRRIARFKELLEDATQSSNPERRAAARAKLRDLPRRPDELSPTVFGCRVSAAHHYSFDRYGLNLSVLWHHLANVATDDQGKSLLATKGRIDFLLASFYLNLVVGVSTAIVGLYDQSLWRVFFGLTISIGLSPAFYALGLAATRDYALALRSLIDTNLEKLAEALGYRLPRDLSDQKRFWILLARYMEFGHSKDYRSLGAYRVDESNERRRLLDPYVPQVKFPHLSSGGGRP